MNGIDETLRKIQWLRQEGFINQALNCGFTAKDIKEGIRILSLPDADPLLSFTEQDHGKH